MFRGNRDFGRGGFELRRPDADGPLGLGQKLAKWAIVALHGGSVLGWGAVLVPTVLVPTVLVRSVVVRSSAIVRMGVLSMAAVVRVKLVRNETMPARTQQGDAAE